MQTVKLVQAVRGIEARLDTVSRFVDGTQTLAGTGLQLEAVRGVVSKPGDTSLKQTNKNVSKMPTMRILRDACF